MSNASSINNSSIKQNESLMSVTLNTTTRPRTYSWEEWGEVLVTTMMTYRRIKGKAPLILNQGPKWRLVVNITSQLLSTLKGPHYPLNRGLDELQIWSGCLETRNTCFHFPDLHPGLSTSYPSRYTNPSERYVPKFEMKFVHLSNITNFRLNETSKFSLGV